ncbi:MAG: glucose-1-phosphate adenylyltransferase subunit GlgD [Negativibacillus sp.]
MSKVLGIVFSNMHETSMGDLTENRTMASVPFGGRYRLIDFTLSNLVNSGIHDVGIIAKNNYQTLMTHVGTGKEWDLSRKNGGLSILPPYGRSEAGVFRGRIEALAGIIQYIKESNAEYVVMTDCDTVATVDYDDILKYHQSKDADITIVYQHKQVSKAQRNNTTVIKLDENHRVYDVMKDHAEDEGNVFLDIIVMRKSLLERIVVESNARGKVSFTEEVLQGQKDKLRIFGYDFKGYIGDIKSIEAYYNCSMDLLNPDIRRHLFPAHRPVYTKVRDEVPVRYGVDAKVGHSLIADGCIIDGEVENSVIFRGVKVGKGAKVRNCILMQGTIVGDNADLSYVIADKNVIIRNSRTLVGCETYPIVIGKGRSV